MQALERTEASEMDEIAERVIEVARRGLIVTVVVLSAVALWRAWPLQTVSAGFQGLGVVLTLLGLAVIGDWLQQAADVRSRDGARPRPFLLAGAGPLT